ncbi:MAG: hypothetical protein U5L45_19815 [Saprospiraceae bacterium]|nr:hypothetical protein [Saprospiraceae bacterium]
MERRENKGTLSYDEAKRVRATISNSILQYVDNWKTADSTSLLDKTILALPIDKDEKLGVLQLVNCDRIKPIKRFKEAFEEKRQAQQPFQFYFICGCPNEMSRKRARQYIRILSQTISLKANTLANKKKLLFIFSNFYYYLKPKKKPIQQINY